MLIWIWQIVQLFKLSISSSSSKTYVIYLLPLLNLKSRTTPKQHYAAKYRVSLRLIFLCLFLILTINNIYRYGNYGASGYYSTPPGAGAPPPAGPPPAAPSYGTAAPYGSSSYPPPPAPGANDAYSSYSTTQQPYGKELESASL